MFNKMGEVNRQKGFTLVEVLTVMLVMAAMASVTVETASTLAFQGRYEVTKDRYEKIKKAIIGDPNQIVNGQPDISGFVADMGRLPTCLRELIDNYNCSTAVPNTVWAIGVCSIPVHINEQDCINNTGIWTQNSGNLKVGWHGPYLQTSHAATDDNALIDGWANSPPTTNDWNYGWVVTSGLNVGDDFKVQSKGKDQAINANGCLNYEDDCEYVVSGGEYTKTITSITVNIMPLDKRTFTDTGSCGNTTYTNKNDCNNAGFIWSAIITPSPPVTPENICLRIYYRQNGAVISAASIPRPIIENGSSHAISFSGFDFDSATLGNQSQVPNGINAIGVFKHNGTNCLSNTTDIYPVGHPLQQVIFAPYKSLDNLYW